MLFCFEALEALEKLRPTCVDTGMTYEERVQLLILGTTTTPERIFGSLKNLRTSTFRRSVLRKEIIQISNLVIARVQSTVCRGGAP